MPIARTPRTLPLLWAIVLLISLMGSLGAVAAPTTTALPPGEHRAAAAQEPEGVIQDPDQHAVVQEGGELAGVDEHAEEAEPKPWFYWPAKWFNFIALCGFLYWMLVVPPAAIRDIFSFPGLRVVLSERAAGIIAARDLAAQQAEEASSLLSDSEQRLSKIADEIAALVDDAKGDAAHEKERSLEDGKLQAEKIIQVAERDVTNERVTANRQLRAFVADLAVKMAETNLTEHLTADDQDRLIREYLSRLSKSAA